MRSYFTHALITDHILCCWFTNWRYTNWTTQPSCGRKTMHMPLFDLHYNFLPPFLLQYVVSVFIMHGPYPISWGFSEHKETDL